MIEDIKVSVVCTTYNHENYIRECLDSLLNQKVDFKYEVLVNDDASTDDTPDILREYITKYPDKLKVYFQKENLFSQGIRIVDDILLPNAKGKYIAICEGDDKWIDKNKLQLQYDIMEKNEDCVMCTHNTIIHDISRVCEDRFFNNWKNLHVLNDYDVFMGWKVHTSSFFIRRQYVVLDYRLRGYWFGDFVRVTYLHSEGKIISIPKVMSQYNIGVSTGALNKFNKSTEKERKEKILDRSKYLKVFNDFTDYRFNNIITKRILLTNLEASSINEFDTLKYSKNKKEVIRAAKLICNKDEYKEYVNSLSVKEKIKSIIRYRGYIIYPIWIKLWQQ